MPSDSRTAIVTGGGQGIGTTAASIRRATGCSPVPLASAVASAWVLLLPLVTIEAQPSPHDSLVLPTGLVYDERMLAYQDRHLYQESPVRLQSLRRHLELAGLIDSLRIIPVKERVDTAILLIHTARHVAGIRRSPAAYSAAKVAVGGVLAAVDAVHSGEVGNAFCAIRPPGHHARNTGREEGFCYFNNVAVGTAYALHHRGFRRILIIDWDYHHGNGTEEFFYSDPRVLYFSTHNRRAYPGTGHPSRRGKGPGNGLNINVDLRCGSGDREMITAWRKDLLPAAAAFRPDLIMISAGFDSRAGDPLGCFGVTDAGFAVLTAMAVEIAEKSGAKLVSVLEGGYDPDGLGKAAVTHVRALMRK